MKKSLISLLTTATILSLTIFISCNKGGDDTPEPSAQEEQFDKLSGTWTVTEGNNGGAVEGWPGVTVTLGGSVDNITYSMGGTTQPEGTDAVWNSSGGSFEWATQEGITTITRNDQVEFTISSVSETQLIVTFTINTSAKQDVVDGDWTFTFTKNS